MHISEFVSFLLIFFCIIQECINCGFKKIWSDLMVSIHCSYLNGMYVRKCVCVCVTCMLPIVVTLVLKVEWLAS